MCVIVVKKQGIKLPEKEVLKNCALNNPHGCGLALWKQGKNRVLIKKDFKNYKKMHNFILKNVNIEDVLVLHFRIATSGLVDKGNRHPIPLTRNIKLLRKTELYCSFAMAHNGVISRWSGYEKYSDTQKFVYNVLSQSIVKNNLHDITIRELIQGYIGDDKIVILDYKGELYLWGNWIEDKEGLLFSNDSYKRKNYYTSIYDYYEDYFCENCFKKTLDLEKYKGICLCKKCYEKVKEEVYGEKTDFFDF